MHEETKELIKMKVDKIKNRLDSLLNDRYEPDKLNCHFTAIDGNMDLIKKKLKFLEE